MNKPVHKVTGALTFQSRLIKVVCAGTAFLISPNLAVTSAHNFYNKQTGEFYRDFKFYPAQCGFLKKPHHIEDLYIPGRFFLNPTVLDDYALFKLR